MVGPAPGKVEAETASETTVVTVCELSGEEIHDYIATGEPMDKAGAYAIQGIASRWIPRIEGDYSNVVGLPVALVYRMLRSGAHSDLRLQILARISSLPLFSFFGSSPSFMAALKLRMPSPIPLPTAEIFPGQKPEARCRQSATNAGRKLTHNSSRMLQALRTRGRTNGTACKKSRLWQLQSQRSDRCI